MGQNGRIAFDINSWEIKKARKCHKAIGVATYKTSKQTQAQMKELSRLFNS